MIFSLEVATTKKTQFIDITSKIEDIAAGSKASSGLCYIFVPHTTAGLTINENADPDVVKDILTHTSKMVPENAGFLHAEGNSAAHIKASLFGFAQTIIIENSKLLLGTWQGIYFAEFDGPRNRKVIVKIVAD